MYLPGQTYDSIEASVYELIEDFDLVHYPLSMRDVCNRLRISLRPYSSLSSEVRAAALDLSKDAFHIGGQYVQMRNIVILYNDDKSDYRIRYNIAHEIGHIVRNVVGDIRERV